MANLTAYIFGTKQDINKWAVRWQLGGVSYIVSKRHKLWSTNSFKLDVSFHPPYVNSAFSFTARFRRRRSANGTRPNYAKQWTVNHANNLLLKSWGHPSRKKIGGQKTLHFFGFLPTSRLNGEYLLSEMWHRQLGKGVGKYEESPKLSQNFMNFGWQKA